MTPWNYDSTVLPLFGLTCYQVGRSNGYQTLTRKSEYDISSSYIDMSSTKFEWASCSGSTFEPGGVIPAVLSVNVFQDCPTLGNVIATPDPNTAAYDGNPRNYQYLYRMRLRYESSRGTFNVEYGPYLICVKKEHGRGSAKLTFNDQLIIFDNITVDLASKSGGAIIGDYCAAFERPFELAGLDPSVSVLHYDSGSIPRFSNEYTGDPLTGRQILSYIMQMTGLCLFSTSHPQESVTTPSWFVTRPLVSSSTDISDLQNIVDWKSGAIRGEWSSVIMIVDDDPIIYGSANVPEAYVFKGNPLVKVGSKNAYQTILEARVLGIEREGFSLQCVLNPRIEPGDLIYFTYSEFSGNVEFTQTKWMVVSRIIWNGGATMTLEEAEFDQYNKI